MAIGDKHGALMISDKGKPNEVATLGSDGKLSEHQRPSAAELGASNENLFDNWLFTADSIIDQKMGYVVPPGTAYYSDTGLTVQVGVVDVYTNVFHAGNVYGVLVIGEDDFYVPFSAMLRGYAGQGYGPDRLKRLYQHTAVLIENDGIKVLLNTNSSSGAQRVSEGIENPSRFSGKTITVSTLIKERTAANTNVIIKYRTSDTGNADTYRVASVSDNGLITLTVKLPENLTLLAFEFDGADTRNGDQFGAYTKFAAVKAEEGTIQTLARKDADGNWQRIDPSPHPTTELDKCQRYYWNTKSTSNYSALSDVFGARTKSRLTGVVSAPVTMRANPNIRVVRGFMVRRPDNSGVKYITKPSQISVAKQGFTSNTVVFDFSLTDGTEPFEVNERYGLLFNNIANADPGTPAGGYLEFDANEF